MIDFVYSGSAPARSSKSLNALPMKALYTAHARDEQVRSIGRQEMTKTDRIFRASAPDWLSECLNALPMKALHTAHAIDKQVRLPSGYQRFIVVALSSSLHDDTGERLGRGGDGGR